MNRILNWVFGSFFRTFGRVLAFLVLGGVAYVIFSKNVNFDDWELPFLFDVVHADTNTISWDTFRWSRSPIECTSQFSGCDLVYVSSMAAPDATWNPTSNEKGTGGFRFRVFMGNNTLKAGTTYQFKIYYSFDSKSFLQSYTMGDLKANTRWEWIYTNTSSAVPNNPNYVSTVNASFDIVNQDWSEHSIIWYINYTPEQDIKFIEFYLITGNFTTHYLDDMSPIFYGYTSYDCQLSSITVIQGVSGTIENSTENIINNNNTNTQNIINNQNQNTQDIINSNKVCNYIDKNKIITNDKFLNNNGYETNLTNIGITDYISIVGATLKQIDTMSSGYNAVHLCFYNQNKEIISCIRSDTYSQDTIIPIPSNSQYVRFSIRSNANRPTYSICQNGNQALVDTLTDDTLQDDTISSILSGLPSPNTQSLGPLTGFLTLPLTWIQSLLYSSYTCTALHLPIPYVDNNYLDLPCMTNFWNGLGAIKYLIELLWLAVIGSRVFNMFYKVTLECLSTSDSSYDRLTKLKEWEL